MTHANTHIPNAPACAAPGVDPDWWFSDKPADREQARQICVRCPLLHDCRTHALDTREQHGIWGGLDVADRRRIWRGVTCGTEEAYHLHRTLGQECEECATAHEERLAADRRARLEAEHAKGGTTTGYNLHYRLGEPACERCLGAQRAASEEQRRKRGVRPLGARARASGSPASPAASRALTGAGSAA